MQAVRQLTCPFLYITASAMLFFTTGCINVYPSSSPNTPVYSSPIPSSQMVYQSRSGKRESRLDAEIRYISQRTHDKSIITSDPSVINAINEARATCRVCDDEYGGITNIQCETEVNMSLSKIFKAVLTAQEGNVSSPATSDKEGSDYKYQKSIDDFNRKIANDPSMQLKKS